MSKHILTLPENKEGRDFVVADIHGCFDLLDKALLAVHFDPSKDRLIAIGDLIDRGTHSPDCLAFLKHPWFHALRGNHEEMFMEVYQDDGKLDFSCLGKRPEWMDWILQECIHTIEEINTEFEKLPIAIEIETKDGIIGFVHADVPKNMTWASFKENLNDDDPLTKEIAIWCEDRIKKEDDSGVEGLTRLFLGHVPVDGGPKQLGNCFCIDTGAAFKQGNPEEEKDFFFTIFNIKASAEKIKKPDQTEYDMVRVAASAENDNTRTPSPPKPPKISI